jgi:ribonuclease-3
MARALELGELLRLGRGEELTGGRTKASLLADAMESVVAAVFLDGGLAGVHRLVDPFLQEAYARAASGGLDRDFKTQLQEQGQARFRTSPRYRVVGEIGPDHLKTFEIEVELRGTVLGRGSGRSKKDAEQAAARVAVEALAAMPPEPVAATPVPPPAAESVAPPPVPEPPEAEPAPAAPEAVLPPAKRATRPPKPGKGAKATKGPKPTKGKGGGAKPGDRPAARKGAPRKAGTRPARKIAVKRGRD